MSRLRSLLRGSALLLLLLQPVLAGPVLMINRNQVRIRADATVQSARIATLRQGDEIEQLGRKDEWFQVRLADGREGWVNALLVQERLVVTGVGVRIRRAGAADSGAFAVTVKGQELGKTGREKGSWYEVVLPDGKKGWIAKKYVRPKEMTIGPDVGRASAAVSPVPQEALAGTAPEIEEGHLSERVVLQADPYAEGLRYEFEENYLAALSSFERVLEKEPNKLRPRIHAALAHKELKDFDAALEDLYYALEISGGRRDIYMHIGEVYRLKGNADSTYKYKTLYKGEDPLLAIKSENKESGEGAESEGLFASIDWRYAAGILGVLAVLGILFGLLRRVFPRGRKVVKPRVEKEEGKFGRELQESKKRRDAGGVSAAEEGELDRQIAEKWQELKQSAEIFALEESPAGEVVKKGEDAHLEQVLAHLETIRKGLEVQDERALIYADIVRLQNMKIEAMNEELRLLGRRRK